MIRQLYDMGLSGTIYSVCHGLGLLAMAVFNFCYSKKYGISKTKAMFFTVAVYAIAYSWMLVHTWMETGFQKFGSRNIVRCFVYVPLIIYFVGKMVKLPWKTLCDYFVPSICLTVGISRIGCVFAGCCRGYPSSWGLYNPKYDIIVFPVQIFEIITIFLIFAGLLWRSRKRNYQADGLQFPMMLVSFGATRFIWEFFRDNDKLWIGCSPLSFHALFMVIVGLDMFITIREKDRENKKKIERYIRNPKKTRRRKK